MTENAEPDPIPAAPISTPAPDPVPAPDPETAAPSTEFARALEAFERGSRPAASAAGAAKALAVGMKVRGRVVTVAHDSLLIEFGGRSEAVAELHPFRDPDGAVRVAVGDELELFVVEAGDQVVLAPSIRADPGAGLAAARVARAAGVPVIGRVTAINAGGLAVDLGGARGFCPLSQIELGFCADPSVYVGRTLEFLVTSIEETRVSAVLSRKLLLRRAEDERARAVLATLKPGAEVEGTVTRLEPFGAFVDLGGADGLVHISEIAHVRVAHPRDALREGERVRVRVLRIDAGKDGRPRIALSIKAASPGPWEGIERRFRAGMRVTGVVARLTDFGAFVTLVPGIDGLVHISQVAAHHIGHVKELLVVGQQVEAVVMAVDAEKQRIALSIREAQEPAVEPAAAAREVAAAPAAPGPEEPTTMAIALRKALEEARKREAIG